MENTWLQTRMYLLIGLLFSVLYSLLIVISHAAGINSLLFYALMACAILFLQYLIGPSIIDRSMKVKYITQAEAPELHQLVGELSQKAGIKKPRIGVVNTQVPNAFAFGRTISDGRICVTRGLLQALSKEELSAVLGHEIAHIKNRDVAVMTLLSVIPMICWYLAWSLMYAPRNSRDGGYAAILGIIALTGYYLTNILILYGSRIREYYADQGSMKIGNKPHALATALYKITYFSACAPPQLIKQIEGNKAFYLNDITKAQTEITRLTEIDINKTGKISEEDLQNLKNKKIKITTTEKITELLSTHPNTLKRIQKLTDAY